MMARCYHRGGIVAHVVGVLGLVLSQYAAATDDGVPGILKYAQSYSAEKFPTAKPKRAAGGGSAAPAKKTAEAVDITALQQRIKTLQGQLTQAEQAQGVQQDALKRAIETREKDVAALARQRSDINALKAQLTVLQQAKNAQVTPQQIEVLKQERDELKQQLQATVTKTQGRIAALEKQAVLDKQALLALKRSSTTALAERDAQLIAAGVSESALKQRLAQANAKQTLSSSSDEPLALDSAADRQVYATGVLFGRDVKAARDANALQGFNMTEPLLLAGLKDAFSGQLKLSDAELEKALDDAEAAAKKGLKSVLATQKEAGVRYVAQFRQEKGAQQDTSLGFWYRIDYVGNDEQIQDDSVVDVVVQESLTDGTVVSDMDDTGAVLTQKTTEFPPVFAAGLKRLKNHGSITLVVPAERAYGDKGYPPKVPPGATMVYRLRVESVTPSAAVKTAPVATVPKPKQ